MAIARDSLLGWPSETSKPPSSARHYQWPGQIGSFLLFSRTLAYFLLRLPRLLMRDTAMARLKHILLMISGAVAVAGALALILSERSLRTSSPSPTDAGSTIIPAKMVGRSTLSHGGPGPTRPLALPEAGFRIGQKVVVVSDSPDSSEKKEIPLLDSLPDAHSSGTASPSRRGVRPGTEVVIKAKADARRGAAGKRELFYEITAPDGLTGWIAEQSLRSQD